MDSNNNQLSYSEKSLAIFIISTILFFILMVLDLSYEIYIVLGIVYGIISVNFVIALLVAVYKDKRDKNEFIKNEREKGIYVDEMRKSLLKIIRQKYEETIKEFDCPYNAKGNIDYKLWVANDKLYIIEALEKCYKDFQLKVDNYLYPTGKINFMKEFDINNYKPNYHVIPIDNIKYFVKEGDIQYETHLSGGGGGGSSIKGAIIGSVIAGEIGSVIGSRQKVNEIKSETITHDTRKTILKYYDNNSLQCLEYPIEFFKIFEELIPDKEYNIVVSKEALKNLKWDDSPENINNKLRQLNKLKDEGLITEEEYFNKKQDLLSKI